MNRSSILRGDVWWVNLDPVVGHEQSKKRPCLVISHDIFNQSKANLVVILPLTTKYKPIPWLIPVESLDKISIKSYIISNQIRTVSVERFIGKKRVFTVNFETLELVESRLRYLLVI